MAPDLSAIVRHADRDRYISVLFAPEDRREALLALYAFNIEIGRLRDVTREPLAGDLRLQWWRDAIADPSAPAESFGHPVAEAMRRATSRYRLPLDAVENMLEARRFDLYTDPMPSVNDLEGYCGETAAALIQLASLVLDADRAPSHAEAAAHAGCAQGITGILALLPRHRARGQVFFPADLMAAAGATEADLAEERPGEAALRAVAAMIALARHHLARFESRATRLPRSLRPAYLPVSFTRPWLLALERAGPEIFEKSVELAPFARYRSQFWRALRGWR